MDALPSLTDCLAATDMSTLSRYSYDMQIEGLIVGHTEETHFFIIITKFLNRYSKAKCYGHSIFTSAASGLKGLSLDIQLRSVSGCQSQSCGLLEVRSVWLKPSSSDTCSMQTG